MLSTSSNETTKYAHSFEIGVGGKVEIVRYDTDDASGPVLYQKLKDEKPDFIIYIGSAWGRQPSLALLSQINAKVAPMVHLCSDAADPPWWPLLREYAAMGCFSLQVAIDGNDNWPGAEQGLTLLTPVDPANFQHVPKHTEREIVCGYGGNAGSPGGMRRSILWEVATHNLLTFRLRDESEYEGYCRFLQNCRMSLNAPHTGTEQKMHVKGRVIESGLAGCCLLEVVDSPTNKWFEPGLDYLEYASIDQCRDYVRALSAEETERRGERLREKILGAHTPAIFWARVLDRIGLKKAA